jgi:glycosyltransferase involved in cell wall biosynthesis
MLVQSPVAGDTRVIREGSTLAAAGHDVRVVGRDVPDDFVPPPGVTVESVDRVAGLRPGRERPARDPLPVRAARWLLLPEHRARVERAWTKAARSLLAAGAPADVVHAHDFNTLELAAELTNRWSVPLVYDSHELWFGRTLPGRPTPVWRRRGARLERILASRARMVLTVSNGIADRLREYGLPDVRVVRNTFPVAEGAVSGPLGPPSGLVYAGRLGGGRDLVTVVEAGARLTPLRTLLVGPADPGFELHLADGVELRPPMSVDHLDAVYREFGIAVVPLTDRGDNHRLALPNKLFHAVRAGVPIVAADLPAIREVVFDHHVGTLYHPGDPSSLAGAVRELVRHYREYVQAVRTAQHLLSWELDSRVLVGAYRDLAGDDG